MSDCTTTFCSEANRGRNSADLLHSPGLTRHVELSASLAPYGRPGGGATLIVSTLRRAGSSRLGPFSVRQPSPLCRRRRKPML
jgi:hypothetical protein